MLEGRFREPHSLVVSTFFLIRIHPTGGRVTEALTAVHPIVTLPCHIKLCTRTHMQTPARASTHTRPQPHCRIGCKGAAGMHFKLGHRELFSYPAPMKPCSADASHALLRLRLIGFGTTESPPADGAGRPRRNACALGIRDRSSRCVYAQKRLVAYLYQSVARWVFQIHAALGVILRG